MKLIISLTLLVQVATSSPASHGASGQRCSRQFRRNQMVKAYSAAGLAGFGLTAAVVPFLTDPRNTNQMGELAVALGMKYNQVVRWAGNLEGLRRYGVMTGIASSVPLFFWAHNRRFQDLIHGALVEAENNEIGARTVGLQSALNHQIYGRPADHQGPRIRTDLSRSNRNELSSSLRGARLSAADVQRSIRTLSDDGVFCSSDNPPERVIEMIVWAHLARQLTER